MGPWFDDASTTQSGGGFWESLTNALLGAGQKYYMGQQEADKEKALAMTIADTVATVVKFVALIFVGGMIVRVLVEVIFRRKS